MMLNEVTPPEMAKQIAPTDCRLRPDQHALEQGLYDEVFALEFGASLISLHALVQSICMSA